jgi:hypothetical protein
MSIAEKFNIPPALLETIKKMNAEGTEYQEKVKALMKKRGFTSIGQMSPEEKKDFFNTLDSMHKAKNEEVELDEAIPKSTGHALVHSSSGKIIAKGNKAEMQKKMKELNAKEKGSHYVGRTSGKAGDTFGFGSSPADKLSVRNEEVDLDEAKSSTGYDLYHKDFSSAMSHAYDFAKKKYNIEIDPTEIDRNVAMGPRKPGSGKANAYRLLDKTGKKAIQVQVANLDNKRYELNMYKEDLDLEESGGPVVYKKGDDHIEKYGDEKFAVYKNGKKTNFYKSIDDAKAALEEDKNLPFTPDKPKKNPGVVPGKYGAGPSIVKHLAKMAMKQQMDKDKKKPMKKEELDEGMSSAQVTKLRQEYDKIKTIDPSSDNYKKLTAMLDKLDLKTLQTLAGAKIKFVSGLAQNRVVRKMNEEVEELDEISADVAKRVAQKRDQDLRKNTPTATQKRRMGRGDWRADPQLHADKARQSAEKRGAKDVYDYNKKEEVEFEEAVNPQMSMKRAGLSVERAKEVMRHQKEIGTIRRKRESLRNSFDPVSTVLEAYKKNKMKKEAIAKDNNKNFKSGDKLSGKTEPIEINPELKEQKT